MAVSSSEIKHPLLVHFRRTLISGLLLLIPVALTYLVVSFLFGLVDGFLRPAMRWGFGQFGVDWTLPGPGLLAAVLLIYLVGLITAFGLGRRAVSRIRALSFRIPFVGAIYSTTHQLVESFSGTSSTGFQRVVLVEFPRENTWSLGFLTGLSDTGGIDKLIMAYVPTAPFPNSGFVIFLPAESVLDTNLSVSEAMQVIFSGGVVSPAAIKTSKIDISELEKDFERSQPAPHSLTDTVKEKILTKTSVAGRASKASAKKEHGSSSEFVGSADNQQGTGSTSDSGMSVGAQALNERRREFEATRNDPH